MRFDPNQKEEIRKQIFCLNIELGEMDMTNSTLTAGASSESDVIKIDESVTKVSPCCPGMMHAGMSRSKRGLPEESVRHVKPRTLLHSENATGSRTFSQRCEALEKVTKNSSLGLASVQPKASPAEENIRVISHEADPCTVLKKASIGIDRVSVESSSKELTCLCLHINRMPPSILIQIFHHLSLADRLMQAALVCHYWHQLTLDPDLWRAVDLRGLTKVDDIVLARIVRYNERVTVLDVTDCRNITDVGLEDTLAVCKDLTKLTLVRCQQLTGQSFRTIANANRHIKELNLSCCFALDDSSLTLIGAGCRSLFALKLNQCSKITDYGITELVQSCSKLERLSVDQCPNLKGDWTKALVANCCCLKSLSCKECPLTAENVKLLSRLSHLTHLEISRNLEVTDEVVIALARGCPMLQCLNLSLCQLVSNEAVAHLVKYCHRLQSLHLVSCAINNKALEFISKCQTLETLDVAYCLEITVDAAVLVSSCCRSLRYLGLMRCDQITDEEAEMLAGKFPHVHYSTMWLDCKRVIEKARQQGYAIPDGVEFCRSNRALFDLCS